LDETRCKAAKHCLEEADIACVAGYMEAVTLVRVFMRWTGATPMQFRDRSRTAASCTSRLCQRSRFVDPPVVPTLIGSRHNRR
jgi:AraC-like DNA-binding protein